MPSDIMTTFLKIMIEFRDLEVCVAISPLIGLAEKIKALSLYNPSGSYRLRVYTESGRIICKSGHDF